MAEVILVSDQDYEFMSVGVLSGIVPQMGSEDLLHKTGGPFCSAICKIYKATVG